MKKVAVFGKPGSGKSVLSKALSSTLKLPLYQLDSIVYEKSGERVSRDVFDKAHDTILNAEQWVIDGFGPISSFQKRLQQADTLIYIDLPYTLSYWFVTKRLLKGFFVKPEGWPDGCSLLKGTLESYKTLKLCPKFWNDDFLSSIKAQANEKDVYVIRTLSELNDFVIKLEK